MKARYLILPLALLSMASADDGKVEPVSVQEPASLVAPANKALVVFARPYGLMRAVKFYILDEAQELLTLLRGKEWTSIAVEPGERTLYVLSENAKLVRADLAAGRTYIVSTEPEMGEHKARVRVELAKRKTASFAESTGWLDKCKPSNPNFEKGHKWTSRHPRVVRRRLEAAEAEWAKMDEREREAVTLGAQDGRTAEEAKQLESR